MLNDLLAAGLRPLVHGEDHPLASFQVIYLLHPRPHNMYGAKDDIALLLAGAKTWKCQLFASTLL